MKSNEQSNTKIKSLLSYGYDTPNSAKIEEAKKNC